MHRDPAAPAVRGGEDRDNAVPTTLRASRPAGAGKLARRIGVARILDAREGRPSAIEVGRLVVQEKLGGGAMGTVYRAHDPALDRWVAVKVLHSGTGTSERDRIVMEARALARLSHPNVVAVYDIINREDELYITMEYVPGGTLRTWLATHPGAAQAVVVSLFLQAGRGLAAAHAAGVVHGDFKPDNVLVGEDGRVRVADFGLARVGAREGRPPPALLEGGTPRYMAPEVRDGAMADGLSDQCSFCLALQEALAAEPPSSDVASNRLARSVPSGVRAVISRGLQREPARRFPDMDALCTALARALGAPPDGRDVIVERVERLWIRGLLAESTGGREAIALRLADATEAVRPPWEKLGVRVELEPGVRSTDDLMDVLEQGHGSLLILGPPGAGKTTTLLMLARELVAVAREDPSAPAPVVLNLASFDPRRSDFVDWVVSELVTKYSLPGRRARAWLRNDALVLLLDGLDEVAPARRKDCMAAIDAFRREHPVPTVVASREDEYASTGSRLEFGVAVRLLPLDDEQIDHLLSSMEAESVVAALQEDDELRARVRNPLMLGVLAVGGTRLDARNKEALWDEIYAHYVDRVFERRGSAAFSREQTTRGLAWLARAMQRHGVTDLWLERLQASWLGEPGERFGARALGALAIAAGIVVIQLVPSVAAALERISTWMVVALSIPAAFILLRSLQIRPVESLRWSWKRALRSLPLAEAIGLVVGLTMGLRHGFAFNLGVGAYVGIVGGVVMGVEPSDREARVRPNEGILQSLHSGLIVGITNAVVGAPLFGFVVVPYVIVPLVGPPPMTPEGLPLAVRYAVVFGSLMFMVYGGAAFLLHAVLRIVLAARSPLPLDLVRFLEHAADRGLLRKVGGGYIFLHRTLLDYFARLNTGDGAPRA